MKVKLTKKYINETKMDGTPFINKKGEPYKMASIEYVTPDGIGKASMYLGKHQDKDLKAIESWEIGQEVDVTIEKSGEYTNFRLMSRTDMIDARVTKLEEAVSKIIRNMKGAK